MIILTIVPLTTLFVPTKDEAVVTILCEWAVTSNRSGEHRAFIAAKLLDQRQTDILSPEGDEEEGGREEDFYGTAATTTNSSTPVFQALAAVVDFGFAR